jgi:hypothetical protein
MPELHAGIGPEEIAERPGIRGRPIIVWETDIGILPKKQPRSLETSKEVTHLWYDAKPDDGEHTATAHRAVYRNRRDARKNATRHMFRMIREQERHW